MMAIQSITDTFDPVEAQLQSILRPIHPSRKFVQTVRKRIQFTPSVRLAAKPLETRHFLLVLGGVLSASLLIITVVRAIFYLVNRSRA
jgi:hypothetical protein